MRAYIEPDDEEFPTAMIDKLDDNGNVIESSAWLTAPKKWSIEFESAEEVLEHLGTNNDNWDWLDNDE